jgi:hypothetical protein
MEAAATIPTTSLARKKYIFIVSAKNVAFMNTKDTYVYLKKMKRKITGKNKYTDIFSGSGYQVILKSSQASEIIQHSSIYTGTLMVKHNGSVSTFNIHGKVDSY